MGLVLLVLAALLLGAPAGAQELPSSSARGNPSLIEDGANSLVPVSLDRIREKLERLPARSILDNLDRRPDFRSEIEVRAKIDALLATLDFKSGPRPAGGLYAYEQQQRAWNSVNNPLMQPYAAFGGAELITLAIEGLAEKYAEKYVGEGVHRISEWDRARTREAARAEVTRAIGAYCAAQPPGQAPLDLCGR